MLYSWIRSCEQWRTLMLSICCYQYVVINMLLSFCWYQYVVINMLLSIYCYHFVVVNMLLSICCYQYVVINMLLSICCYQYRLFSAVSVREIGHQFSSFLDSVNEVPSDFLVYIISFNHSCVCRIKLYITLFIRYNWALVWMYVHS